MPVAVPRKPRVYALSPLHSEALALAKQHFDLVLPGDESHAAWRDDAEGILARSNVVTPEDMAYMKKVGKLRFMGKMGVGVDNFDLESVRKSGIPLMNTPGINATAVAELTLGLMLDVARLVTKTDRRLRAGEAVGKLDGWAGQTIRGKTVGIIGGGNIGFAVGKMMHLAFQCPIILYDPYIASSQLAKWDLIFPAPSSDLTIVTSVDEVVRSADIVTLHCPLNAETTDMISTREIEMMKPTGILINCARGGIVNEDDLVDCLQRGVIHGAGVDAFTVEPPTREKYEGMCKLDNIVLTPHFGATPAQVQQDTCRSMVEHLIEAFEGKPLRDRVA